MESTALQLTKRGQLNGSYGRTEAEDIKRIIFMGKLSATSLVKFGKRMSPLTGFLFPCSVVVFFFVTMGIISLESQPFEASMMINVSLIVTIPLIVIGFVQAVLLRARNVAGQPVTAERYAFIADELKLRGIKNARRFMAEHPHYDDALYRLMSDVYNAVGEDKTVALGTLVYSSDSDPERTREIVSSIVNDRGVTSREEVRTLLHDVLNAETSLGSGIL